MKKIVGICLILMLVVSIITLGGSQDRNVVASFDVGISDDMNTPLGNETEDPDGNETEDPEGNETEDPEGNETNIDNETEDEIEIMNTELGAEIRLLQLEKAILKNLLKGEQAVVVLQEMGYNTTELEAILDEMRLVLEAVQAANVSDNDSVQQFIDLKSDARKLTKSFRETIKDLLNGDKIKDLKEQIQEIVDDELQNYSKKIRVRIKQFNRNQIHRLSVFFGDGNETDDGNETLAAAYEDDTLSLEDIKSQLRKKVNEMTKEKKNQMFSELKKDKINNKNFANEEVTDALDNFEERENKRSENRGKKGGNGKGKGHDK